MAEVVAGAAVSATIRVVIQNLLSFPAEEISLIWNFSKDLEKLKQSIIIIDDFLEDAEMKPVTDKAVKRWLKKLEAVAFHADHVFDELSYQLLRSKMKNKVSSFFSTSSPIVFRLRMAKRIKDINNELKSINKEARGLGLHTRLGADHAPGAGTNELAYLESDSFAEDPVFVGRENEVNKVMEMVTSSPTDEQVLSVLPIFGMGGLGKTTLARKVYKDSRVASCFRSYIWVHVSENFDPVKVLKSVVESFTRVNVDGSREVVLQIFQEKIGNTRYLLVLDNVLNADPYKWENFINSLEGVSRVKGNVIILTTRNEKVASTVKTIDIPRLGMLPEEHCWFIIKAKVFRRGGNPIEFYETIGRRIAERCKGLPLAAKVVGSLLSDQYSKDGWLSIEKKMNFTFGEIGDIVSKILKLSFDNLSSPTLKKCFAYCSIFPKGYRITREELVELWIAEGLLRTDQENDMESMGNNVLNILIQSSLLHVTGRDCYENVKHCGMHDLVHDLALSISKPLDHTYEVRYIFPTSLEVESSPIPKKGVKCLRTLFFNGKVSQLMFSKLKCLHVLILHSKDIQELPIMIGKLVHLRYIDVSRTRIRSLPDSIGELFLLQTLRVSEYFRKFPDSFNYLINLRHLHIPNIRLPAEIGSLTYLQTLPYFQVSDETGYGIVELGKLKNLKGEIEIHNLEKVRTKEEAESTDLFHKSNILKLKLVWNESREGDIIDENVLEGLQPHPDLKSLEIKGFKSQMFPLWTTQMAVREQLQTCWVTLANLIDVTLSDCKECKEVPMLGHLPHLKSLYLDNLTNVESIGCSFYGIKENGGCKESITVFPALERFQLRNMKNLIAWTEVELSSSSKIQSCEISVFPRLEYLRITHCWKLITAPSHFPSLKELDIYKMKSGLPLANICGSKLSSLTKLKIREVHELRCFPDWLLYNNRDLLELDISFCDELTHLVPYLGGGGASLRKLVIVCCKKYEKLPQDLHSLIALEVLNIELCPSLTSIPYQSGGQSSAQGFTSLRQLRIHCCNKLANLSSEMIESCAPSLERVCLMGLSSTILRQVMRILHRMPRLTQLNIEEAPTSIDEAAEIGSLCSLQCLTIHGSSDNSDYGPIKASLDRFFLIAQSLRDLTFYGMKHWDALPVLQHLTALRWLLLGNFGIESLPEWLGKLSSLKILHLFKCWELRRLPSRVTMRGLTNLTDIYINECPLLKQNLEHEASGFEWSKISHIPNIIVNESPFPPRGM